MALDYTLFLEEHLPPSYLHRFAPRLSNDEELLSMSLVKIRTGTRRLIHEELRFAPNTCLYFTLAKDQSERAVNRLVELVSTILASVPGCAALLFTQASSPLLVRDKTGIVLNEKSTDFWTPLRRELLGHHQRFSTLPVF